MHARAEFIRRAFRPAQRWRGHINIQELAKLDHFSATDSQEFATTSWTAFQVNMLQDTGPLYGVRKTAMYPGVALATAVRLY